MPLHTAPYLITDFVVVDMDGTENENVHIAHEPRTGAERFLEAVEAGDWERARDMLNGKPNANDRTAIFRVTLPSRREGEPGLTPLAHAVAQGDEKMTRVLVDAIADRRDGWGQLHFNAATHFNLLREGLRGATLKSGKALDVCLDVMRRIPDVRREAERQLPELLGTMRPFGGGAEDVTRSPDRAARTAGWFNGVVAAAKDGKLISRADALKLLIDSHGSSPLREALGTDVALFKAMIEGYVHAGREKVISSLQLLTLMWGLQGEDSVLYTAAHGDEPDAVSAYVLAVHAARSGGALPSDSDYLSLLRAGRGIRTLMPSLCHPNASPATLEALKAYLKSVLNATVKTVTPDLLLSVMLALGDDGRPALTQCSPAQAKFVRDALSMAVEDGRLAQETVDHILRHLPPSDGAQALPAT